MTSYKIEADTISCRSKRDLTSDNGLRIMWHIERKDYVRRFRPLTVGCGEINSYTRGRE